MPELVYLDSNKDGPFTNLDMTIFYRFNLNGHVHVLPYVSFYEVFNNHLRRKHFKNYDKPCLVPETRLKSPTTNPLNVGGIKNGKIL